MGIAVLVDERFHVAITPHAHERLATSSPVLLLPVLHPFVPEDVVFTEILSGGVHCVAAPVQGLDRLPSCGWG